MCSEGKANRFIDGLEVGFIRRKKARNDSKGFGPSNPKDGGATY